MDRLEFCFLGAITQLAAFWMIDVGSQIAIGKPLEPLGLWALPYTRRQNKFQMFISGSETWLIDVDDDDTTLVGGGVLFISL